MTKSMHHSVAPVHAIAPVAISGSVLTGSGIDLQGYESCEFLLVMGDIDEMGGSPVGGAQIAWSLQDSPDDSVWTNVDAVDVVADVTVASGIVGTPTNDASILKAAYVGEKRYVRSVLTPTALTNGGPVAVVAVKGAVRHNPASDTQAP